MYARSWANRNTVWLGHMDSQSYSTILQFYVACCPKPADRFLIYVNWIISSAVFQMIDIAVSARTRIKAHQLFL